VSLSPSTLRPFDAPEFIFPLRYRRPTRGSFLPLRHIQSQPLILASFGIPSNLPNPYHHSGLTCRKVGLGIGFLSLSERLLHPVAKIEVDLLFPLIFPQLLSTQPISRMPTSSGAYTLRSAVRSNPHLGVSASEPIGPAGERLPAETDHVPPEQLPLSRVYPVSAPMQSISASPLEVCEARIRELELMFAEMSSYTKALESRISDLEPVLPQVQDAEFKAVEALEGANAIAARVSLLEQVTARAHFEHIVPHRGSAAPAEEVTGRQGGRNRMSGHGISDSIPRDPTADPQGQRDFICSGKQDKKRREKPEISYPISDEEDSDFSDGSDELALNRDVDQLKGPAVPGLREIVPSRSDYRTLVSYRTYRLVDRNQKYDPTVTAKLAIFVKRLKHAIEDKFGGEEPIEVLQFLRTFKEAADHNRVSEGAAARLIPYFLKGIAKEGYRAQLGDVPVAMPKYPFMVQYLLETYAVDEELAKAYHAAASARQNDGEDEKAFGRRLQRAAILAGNVLDQMNLKTIFIEGLPPYVQAGLRLHVTPGMSFDQVQRVAHNLGTSLRQTMAQAPSSKAIKTPLGVKPLLVRGSSVQVVDDVEDSETLVAVSEDSTPNVDDRGGPAAVHALWATQPAQARTLSSPSPSSSTVSIPTRGWASPVGSTMSAQAARYSPGPPGHLPRVSPAKPAMCYLCYGPGHFIMDCPRLPSDVRREANENRDAFYRQSPIGVPMPGASHGQSDPAVGRRPGNFQGRTHPWEAGLSPRGAQVIHAVEEVEPSEEDIEEGKLQITGAENALGGN
jgi:hypothetical protein